jgi:large subunit ribosomal protein L3
MILMGTKLGMTRVLQESGESVCVTVIKLGPCTVTQLKSAEKDGYSAVQIGYGDMKPRNSTMPRIGHDAKAGCEPKRHHREFKIKPEEAAGYELGKELTVAALEGQMYVDVIGTSKGKGFAGVMKRWHFKGLCASHGTERKHRSPGSISSLCSNRGYGGGLAKDKKMPGRMGNARVTVRSLDVVRIEPERNLLLVKGPVPGPNNEMVMVRPSTRLYKSKAKKVLAVAKK